MMKSRKSEKAKFSMYGGTSASFIFWGIVATIGPLAASQGFIKLSSLQSHLILLIPPIALLLGNLILGIFSDLMGRKHIFVLSILLYSTGIIIASLSYSFIPLLIGIMLAEFGVGGQEPSSLALITENTDAPVRPFWLTIITNMNNIGSAFISLIFIFFHGTEISRILLLTTSLIVIGLILYTSFFFPESFLWEKKKGNDKWKIDREIIGVEDEGKFEDRINPIFSYIFLLTIGISQYLTFGLMAYVLAPVEFNSNIASTMIFVALLGASVAGFFAAYLINRETKMYTLISFSAGTLSTLVMLLLLPYLNSMMLFLPLLFLNMAASEFAWASRSVLEPQMTGTGMRSTFIGMVRIGPMIAYPLFTYLTFSLNLSQFIELNLLLWDMGLVASTLWYIFGVEVVNRKIDTDTGMHDETAST